MSSIIAIADAVVTELNAHNFSQPLTAVRHYVPTFDLKDMQDLHVSVVPRGVEISTAGRGIVQRGIQVDIGVQKKIAGDAEIDGMMSLVDEIAEFFRAKRRFGSALWVKTANFPIYSPEHLHELRQFTSVLTVTLRTVTA